MSLGYDVPASFPKKQSMKTVTIQIGNSDDKLKQVEWADFVHTINAALRLHAAVIHFAGTSEGSKAWQNAAWVCEVPKEGLTRLRQEVSAIGRNYKQDSVAWTEGETLFV